MQNDMYRRSVGNKQRQWTTPKVGRNWKPNLLGQLTKTDDINIVEAEQLIASLERFRRGKPSNIQADINNAIIAIYAWIDDYIHLKL